MELKWIVIGMVAWGVAMMGGLALEQHNTNVCRVAAINGGKLGANEIKEICK